jgi:hypothetical protein
MSSLGTLRPKGRRRAVLVASGVAAVGVLAALLPRAYEVARREVLISRLEKGDDPEARRELADPRHAARLHARLRESASPRLVGPLIDLAAERRLDPAIRADVFDRFLQPEFTDGSQVRASVTKEPGPIFPEGCQVFVSMARSGTTEFVDLGEWTGRSYTVPRQSTNGDVVQFMEWFVIGEGPGARLVHQRLTWVIIPPGEPSGPLRIETEDLTDSPDPLTFFLGRPMKAKGPGDEPVTVLQLGTFGSWRQFVPGLPRLEKAFSYAVYLDRPEADGGPFLLGWVAATEVNPAGRGRIVWRGRSEIVVGGTVVLALAVPESAARLEPFQKLKLLFRPAPEFAAESGVTAPEADSPPFEREMYLPPAER